MTDNLASLLPSVYLARDAEQANGELAALLSILQEQADVLDRDIEELYDNWFIETCDAWVVPYIGDLLGVRGLYPVGPATANQRAYVANTLGYRRRKGTVGVLEDLAFDVTGWHAKAVEFFLLLETTQYAKHIRLENVRTPDLRDGNALELVDGPFEHAAHTGEVRRVVRGRGRYNIANIGIHLWRLGAYPLTRTTARNAGAPERFTFSPLGLDAPLFNPPRTEPTAALVTELNVPAMLRRRALFDELEAGRQALVDGTDPPRAYFDPARPVLRVFAGPSGGPLAEIEAHELLVADLSLWQLPPGTKTYLRKADGTSVPMPIAAAVDPKLGRLTFPASATPDEVQVSYAYGFPFDLGGGPYDRVPFLDRDFASRVRWQAAVGLDVTPVPGQVFASLRDAIDAWNAQPAGTTGVIAMLDNHSYAESLTGSHGIELKDDSELLVVAADWPEVDVLGLPTRIVGHWVPQERRAHVRGDLEVKGSAPASSDVAGRLTIEGLLVEGTVTVLAGNLGRLRVVDTTIVPAPGSLTVASGNSALEVTLERAICGAVTLPATVPELSVGDSIVDAPGAAAIKAPGSAASINATTVLGTTQVRSLNASNAIFTEAVSVERRQVGCVRFSFVPPGAATRTPRRYRCQPDLALRDVTDAAQQAAIRARLVPTFTSTTYGDPAYLQLTRSCAVEIRTGADDGAEQGVGASLKQPQREANLGVALDEYLRFGLEAGIFYVT